MSHLKLENSNKVKSWDWFLLPFPKLDIWGLLYYYICTYMHACVSIKYQTFRIIYSKFQFLHKYISPHTHTHTHIIHLKDLSKDIWSITTYQKLLMGCLSGCLMSSVSIQKLFCGICSAFKHFFNEFVGEKVVSPSYSSAILGSPPY